MYNLIAYISYLLLIVTVIVAVGHYLYRSGQVFIDRSVGEASLGSTINKLLLTGYYLFNLGAAIYVISTWPALSHSDEIISSLIFYLSRLIIVLGVMHYFNIAIILNINKLKS